jgi:hypothetical protein
MGICYTAIIMDEFDWHYTNRLRDETIDDIKQIEYVSVLSDQPTMIIIDIGKTPPEQLRDDLKERNIPFDAIYYEEGWNCELIKLK